MRPIVAVLPHFLVLFIGSGIAQVLPWGVPSAQSLRAASPETVAAFGPDAVATHPPGTFTTDVFGTSMVGEVSVLMTAPGS